MIFNNNRIRSIEYKMECAEIAQLKKEWKKYAKAIEVYPGTRYTGKGVVYTGGGISYITCLWVSINRLRDSGCILPIEVWYLGNEISIEVMEFFKVLDVSFRNFREIEPIDRTGYHLKPLAILYSSFEEVLFLDTDNICFSDPSYLFNLSEYKETGTIFWPDFWLTDKQNPIWEIVESNDVNTPEQESGQLLINKKECWAELNLCIHFNKLKIYQTLLYGDKDTFKFAWLALKRKFYMIPKLPSSCGIMVNGTFFGNTMVQYDPAQSVVFLHRNLMKWDVTLSGERFWQIIKSFKGDARTKTISLKKLNHKIMIDLIGHTECINVSDEITQIEDICIKYLQTWRNSEVSHRFFQHAHLLHNRFSLFRPFSL